MRAKYISRKKEIVAYDYYTDGTYMETRFYKNWVYKRADGSEFLTLDHPTPVKRDYRNKPFVRRDAWHDNCWQIVTEHANSGNSTSHPAPSCPTAR